MELSTHLQFNGQCATAFRFYEQCLGGRIVVLLTHGETPAKDQVAADWQDKVIHARLVVGNKALMGCDAPSPHYAPPRGMQVSLSVATQAEAERIFNALAEDGKVTMPFQRTFWSPGFGMAVDRFGIPWMINTEQAA
ncbi:MAG: VOC family protein [Acidobacteriia bacterium]|nr:VOC family protein [Terriglobia bacterium]